ncbi:MAG TPA: TatD family hydrolase, partial [Clostridia bacterium]|nr:TatD family hydrolase [Clostridia bacterium]
LALAAELDMPVIIHDREAHGDAMAILRKYRVKGVMHCFSGSAEMAKELLSMGFYLGFTGSVTFKNNKKAAQVVPIVPAERILIETDCPYMAPEPLRGRRCDSSMLIHTLSHIARLKGLEPEDLAGVTAANARRFFGIHQTSAKAANAR